MNNSLDHQIVTTLATLLGRISVTNGFATEAGAYVVTEEQRAKIPESAIVLGVFDDTETRSSDGQGVLRGTGELSLRVTLQVPIKLADSDPTQFVPVRAVARAVMQDIRRAIAAVPLNNYAGTTPDGPRFPVGVTGLRITGRSLPPLEEDSSYQSGSVDLICTFNETHLPKE